MVRDYNYNTDTNKLKALYKEFSQTNIVQKHNNLATRGSNYIDYFKAKQNRIRLLENTNEEWTVKENLEKLTIDWKFINYCAKSGVNIYLPHRRDVTSQFISKINARYRSEIARLKGDGHFIYTNNMEAETYNEIRINFRWLHMYVNVFLEQLMMWRIIYETYPNIRVVSYEDEIKPMKFDRLNISQATIKNYKQLTQHLVPTPFNTDKVIIIDDHPKPIPGAWEQALFYINHHKHLVEI